MLLLLLCGRKPGLSGDNIKSSLSTPPTRVTDPDALHLLREAAAQRKPETTKNL